MISKISMRGVTWMDIFGRGGDYCVVRKKQTCVYRGLPVMGCVGKIDRIRVLYIAV